MMFLEHNKHLTNALQWQGPLHYCVIFTARKRSLGQGNVFTCVCHSVYWWGGISVWCHFLSDCLVPCSFGRVSVSGPMSLLGSLCPGEGAVCLGVSLCRGSLSRGSLSGRPPNRDPRTVKSGQYTSYWNAFLLCTISSYLFWPYWRNQFDNNVTFIILVINKLPFLCILGFKYQFSVYTRSINRTRWHLLFW